MKSDFNPEIVAEMSAYVAEVVSAIQQGEQVPKEDLENLQALVDFLNGLDVTGTGAHIREGIAKGMTEAGFDSDAETVASNLETALNTALDMPWSEAYRGLCSVRSEIDVWLAVSRYLRENYRNWTAYSDCL